MPSISITIPASLAALLEAEVRKSSDSLSAIATRAIADYLDTQIHTLFQVSTSGSMVAGVYQAAVNVGVILQHGDFGVGTFENLDGEMIVLDGIVYRAQANGVVVVASPEDSAPFAVVTKFTPSVDLDTGMFDSLVQLANLCDQQRSSNNLFYAFRLDGLFKTLHVRAVRPPIQGGLLEAAEAQAEYSFQDTRGTLVGLWSPGFSSAFSVAGYHFHFLSEDRRQGGHLLECAGCTVRLRSQALANFHLALPETESFLKADLSKSSNEDLAYAEQAH